MCDYRGQEFGANYPDSVCIDGYLWDADSGNATVDGWEYTHGGELPCPACNETEAIERLAELLADNDEDDKATPEKYADEASRRVRDHVVKMNLKWAAQAAHMEQGEKE
jgi:hypothetical protein